MSAVLITTKVYGARFALWFPLGICSAIFIWVRRHEKQTIAQCKADYKLWELDKSKPPPPKIDYQLECHTLNYMESYADLQQRKHIMDITDEEMETLQQKPARCYKCNRMVESSFYLADNFNHYHLDCVRGLF